MRLNKDDTGLRLVTTARERQLIDAAFEEVLNLTPLDDWQVRTGASREELWTVWWSLAGKRSDPQGRGGMAPDEGSTDISERALEVLEPVLFEIARARLIPERRLEAVTGATLGEWRDLWLRARELVAEAWVGPVRDDAGEHALLPAGGLWAADREIVGFRQLGGSLVDATIGGVALEIGEVRAAVVTHGTFRDVACRAVRLVDSRLVDCSISGSFSDSSIVDCELEGVSLSGRLSNVRLIGNAYRLVDLRSAMLDGCRFYEVGPERDVRLPDGRDCFVVRRRTLPHALSTLRGRVGERTHDALTLWFEEEDGEFVSIAARFWEGEIVPRGGDRNFEVELAVLDRLFRARCATLG